MADKPSIFIKLSTTSTPFHFSYLSSYFARTSCNRKLSALHLRVTLKTKINRDYSKRFLETYCIVCIIFATDNLCKLNLVDKDCVDIN